MATTLQTYVTEVRRLLHDAAGNFWSDQELTDYINDARNRIAADTSCTRATASITLNTQFITGNVIATSNLANTAQAQVSQVTNVVPTPDYSWIGASIAPATITANGLSSNGSTDLSVGTTSGLVQGMAVSGPGIASGTTIASVNNSVDLTLSQAAGSGAGTGTFTFTYTGTFSGIAGSSVIIQRVDIPNDTIYVAGPMTTGLVSFLYFQEAFPYSSVTTSSGNPIIDVLNITATWGNTRYVLQYKDWSAYNAIMRSYAQFQQRPAVWSKQGQNIIWIGPVVDQPYVVEWDCVTEPNTLANMSDVETIAYPFTQPVKYWAAHLAKFRDGSFPEAEAFEQKYVSSVQYALKASMIRRIPNIYSNL